MNIKSQFKLNLFTKVLRTLILNSVSILTLITLFLLAPTHSKAEVYGNFNVGDHTFAELFSKQRIGQPKNTPWISNYFPYGYHGTAVLLNSNGDQDPQGTSPMHAYNLLANIKDQQNAHTWEVENHTCDNLSPEDKQGCINWWGHCNGWAAAAIKDPEPKGNITVHNNTLTVADQKGILSELWLSSGALFVGDTDKGKKTGDWVLDPQNPSYRGYWEISPRTFFMVFTTYIGTMKMGLAIDRFTGDEVWNQPIVGYRHLPLRPQDIQILNKDGKNLWSVYIRTKIFWANDDGIPAGRVSTPFDIKKHSSDSPELEMPYDLPGGNEYASRLLEYKLFFDAPVEIDSTGTTVTSAGNMVGDGIWAHQENAKSLSFYQLDNSHPDFIWLPTNPFRDLQSGYGNPFMVASVVNEMFQGKSSNNTNQPPTKDSKKSSEGAQQYQLTFDIKDLTPKNGGTPTAEYISGRLRRLLVRGNIRVSLRKADIQITDKQVFLKVAFPGGETKKQIEEFMADANIKVLIQPVSK